MEIADLAGAYNASKVQGRKPKSKPGSLAASQVLGCQRRLALRVQGAVEPYQEGAPWLSEGEMHEAEIVQRLRKLGFRVTMAGEDEGWFTLHIHGVRVRGQADGGLPHQSAILEIKSVASEDRLMRMNAPYDSWRTQAEVYMRAFELPRTVLFAKARDTGRARQWQFRRSERRWARIIQNIQQVTQINDPWNLHVDRQPECQWCPWKEKCWGADPEIDLSAW